MVIGKEIKIKMRIEIDIMIGGTRKVVIFMTHNNQDYEDYN